MKLLYLKQLLFAVTCFALVAMGFVAPIPQDLAYHHFADQRQVAFLPNFWNVVSNLGFLYVGALGLYRLYVVQRLVIVTPIRLLYGMFFLGVTLVAFGSGFYHLHPDNSSLIWDRLPMTMAFMALTSIVLAEFLSLNWGRRAFWPLLCVGVGSALYWYWGESRGLGDLRAYVLVQFLPVLLILLLLMLGRNVFNTCAGYGVVLIAYVLAKMTEHFDAQIYEWTHQMMAGHALKHFLAACGLYGLLRSFQSRVMRYHVNK